MSEPTPTQPVASPIPPPRPKRRRLWLLVVLCIALPIGGYCYYEFGYQSESSMLKRIEPMMNTGDTHAVESMLKECIRKHDSNSAKIKLVTLYVKTGDFQKMLLLDKTMIRGFSGDNYQLDARHMAHVFGNGYRELASDEFDRKEWGEASKHYFTAYLKYGEADSFFESNDYKPDATKGMECLRNAAAASFNANDASAVEMYGRELIKAYDRIPAEQRGEDSGPLKNLEEVKRFMVDMETRK
jgi:hypothetical protein